jgi:hypothetical protein
LNVQESILSEVEACPAQKLKLLLDERSLGFVQRLALCSACDSSIPVTWFGMSHEYTVTPVTAAKALRGDVKLFPQVSHLVIAMSSMWTSANV